MEGIEDRALSPRLDTQKEVRGKVQAENAGSARTGHMEVKDAQRDRKTLPAIDHIHQVGVVHVFVGFGVAFVAMFARQQLAQGRYLHGDAGRRTDQGAGLRRQHGEMVAVGPDVRVRPVEGREHQRGLGQVDVRVVTGSNFAKCFFQLRPL